MREKEKETEGKENSLERVEVQGKEKLRGKGEIFGEGGGTGKERGEIKS